MIGFNSLYGLLGMGCKLARELKLHLSSDIHMWYSLLHLVYPPPPSVSSVSSVSFFISQPSRRLRLRSSTHFCPETPVSSTLELKATL